MNQYVIKQIRKAIEKNNGEIPEFVDSYNAAPIKNVCCTITTSTGKWGGVEVYS